MTVGDEVEGVKREAESQVVETKKQKKAAETSEPESETKPAAAVSLNFSIKSTPNYPGCSLARQFQENLKS